LRGGSGIDYLFVEALSLLVFSLVGTSIKTGILFFSKTYRLLRETADALSTSFLLILTCVLSLLTCKSSIGAATPPPSMRHENSFSLSISLMHSINCYYDLFITFSEEALSCESEFNGGGAMASSGYAAAVECFLWELFESSLETLST
jgi:hypothetical protein